MLASENTNWTDDTKTGWDEGREVYQEAGGEAEREAKPSPPVLTWLKAELPWGRDGHWGRDRH